MWKLILLFLISFSLKVAAQSDTLNRTDKQGRKTGYWISRDPSGIKIYEGSFSEGRPAGKMLRYHANGKIRAEMNYQPGAARVDARLFDTEGRIRAEGTYLNQLKDGTWSFYSEKKNPVFRMRISFPTAKHALLSPKLTEESPPYRKLS